jgi:hypothetical protein
MPLGELNDHGHRDSNRYHDPHWQRERRYRHYPDGDAYSHSGLRLAPEAWTG